VPHNIGFVADNDRVKMRQALDTLIQSGRLDICSAYVDAFGIAAVGGSVDTVPLRLLVGFNLSEMPVDQDIVTFQMADEWNINHTDTVHRQADDATVQAAVSALQNPNFSVARCPRKTHSKLYLSPDMGVVGSSNLTRPGIEGQRELNLLQYEPDAVSRLREWFEGKWREAKHAERSDFKKELIEWLQTNRLRRFAPFHPYAKAIYERFRNRFLSLSPSATDVNLAVFQEEGRDIALGILAEHKCCIIADAVGLGKTYVALGAMHRRAKSRERSQRRILIVCPAQLRGMWEKAGQEQNIPLVTASMESLGRTSGTQAERRPQELSDYGLVIVDEAHNFRNHRAQRFMTLMEILQGGPVDKEVLLLTATPINNGIEDLYSLYRLMVRDRDNFFVNTNLRIPSLRDFFKQVVKVGRPTTDLLLETMVCRSRLDIRRRQEKGETIVIDEQEVRFPNRKMESLEYELASTGETLRYADVSTAVQSLTLGAYNVEQYAKNPDKQKTQTFLRLQTLFRILLLKRLESSVVSFVSTAESLLRFSDKVVEALEAGRCLTNDEYRRLQLDFVQQLEDDDDKDDSAYFAELRERNPEEYDLTRLEKDVSADHARLSPVILRAKALCGSRDGKLAKLKERLASLLPEKKALVFTFYADTADYLYRELTSDSAFMQRIGNVRVEKVVGGDSSSSTDRTSIVNDFAPIANKAQIPMHPIQLLISTDVLSEGQNLQDCGFVINYDLHFNPVRMIQRNGRIDRLFSHHEEITIANFFPEGGLEGELKLVEALQRKIDDIRGNLPLDASVLGEKVRVFSLEELRRTRAGDARIIDEIDAENPVNRFHDLLNEVVKMLQDFGVEEVNKIPFGCQSNKRSTHKGVFLCVAAGTREEQKHCWWLYYDIAPSDGTLFPEPIQEPGAIIELIRSQKPPTADLCRPDFTPRDIHWDIILDAKKRCREMLLQQTLSEAQGQVWPATHINKKLKTFLVVRPYDDPTDIEKRLGRFSLERHKETAEGLLRSAQQSRDISSLLQWLDATLPHITVGRDNPETMPLEVVSYLELVPETEGVA